MYQSRNSNRVMETGDHFKNGASPKSQISRRNIMQRTFLLLFVFLVSAVTAFSQDIITLKNGNDIQALVQEIGENDVKYKKFENQSGPVYTMKKAEILMIRYANGSKDVFAADTTPESTPTKAEVQQQTTVNQQINPNNSSTNAQQQLPAVKSTSGKQINPYGPKKSLFLAGFLSFIIPGVGQFYNGEVSYGLWDLGSYILFNTIGMVSKDKGIEEFSRTSSNDKYIYNNQAINLQRILWLVTDGGGITNSDIDYINSLSNN